MLCSLVLLGGLAGCGNKDGNSETASARDESRSLDGARGNDDAWRQRYTGLPSADDPRLDDLSFLRTLPPSAPVSLAIGNLFFRRAQLDSALAYYQDAVTRDPSYSPASNSLGICLVRLERLDEAERVYRDAIAIESYDPHAHTNLGNLFFRRGELKKAISSYRVSTTIDSTDATVWLNLALALEKDDQVNPAILAYNKVTKLSPRDPKPWERLGWIYYSRQMYKAARNRWTEAVERDPSRQDLRDNIRKLQDYADSSGTG